MFNFTLFVMSLVKLLYVASACFCWLVGSFYKVYKIRKCILYCIHTLWKTTSKEYFVFLHAYSALVSIHSTYMYLNNSLAWCVEVYTNLCMYIICNFFFSEELRKFTISDFPKQTHLGYTLITLFFPYNQPLIDPHFTKMFLCWLH